MEANPQRERSARQVFLIALSVLAAYLCFTIVRPFLMPMVAATALAILFYPVYERISHVIRNRNAAAVLSVVVVLLVTLIPAVLLSRGVARELQQLYSSLASKSSASGGWEPWLTHLLERPLNIVGIDVEDPNFSLGAIVTGWVESASATLVRVLRSMITNLAGILLNGMVTLFSLFFLFRDGQAIRRYAMQVLPLEPRQIERLFSEVGRSVIANMYGVLAVATAQGGLTGLAFLVLGLPSPVLWGLVAGLFSMIPLVGPPIVWVPASIYLAVSGSWGKAIILVALGAGVIGLADNFIRPYVVSGRVKLHPLLVFFALLGGAQSFGLMGLFIGPAVVAVTVALVELLREPAASIHDAG
jgi:predicted PurR-regulated permease PerM